MKLKQETTWLFIIGFFLLLSVGFNISQSSQIKQMESDISSCESQVSDLKNKITDIELDLKTCQENFESCREDLSDCQSRRYETSYDSGSYFIF